MTAAASRDRVASGPATHQPRHAIETDMTLIGRQIRFCGTTACFAGHTCARSGYRPLFDYDDAPTNRVTGRVNLDGAEDGDWRWVGDTAQQVLGLTPGEAKRLFAAYNTLDDLHSMVKQIHGAPYEDLSWERAS